MQMKKTRCLKMLALVLVLVCGGNLAVGAVIANFSNDWSATSGPGQGWSCQWANWDQNSPSTFQDLVWDGVTGRMIKADQPDHFAPLPNRISSGVIGALNITFWVSISNAGIFRYH